MKILAFNNFIKTKDSEFLEPVYKDFSAEFKKIQNEFFKLSKEIGDFEILKSVDLDSEINAKILNQDLKNYFKSEGLIGNTDFFLNTDVLENIQIQDINIWTKGDLFEKFEAFCITFDLPRTFESYRTFLRIRSEFVSGNVTRYVIKKTLIRIYKNTIYKITRLYQSLREHIPIKYAIQKYFDQIFTIKDNIGFVLMNHLFIPYYQLIIVNIYEKKRIIRPT